MKIIHIYNIYNKKDYLQEKNMLLAIPWQTLVKCQVPGNWYYGEYKIGSWFQSIFVIIYNVLYVLCCHPHRLSFQVFLPSM